MTKRLNNSRLKYEPLSGRKRKPAKSPEDERWDLILDTLKGSGQRRLEAEEKASVEVPAIPLNGPQVLKQALGGHHPDMTGPTADSAADLLRRAIENN